MKVRWRSGSMWAMSCHAMSYFFLLQWTVDKKVGERKMGNGKGINSSWTQTVPMRQPLS